MIKRAAAAGDNKIFKWYKWSNKLKQTNGSICYEKENFKDIVLTDMLVNSHARIQRGGGTGGPDPPPPGIAR